MSTFEPGRPQPAATRGELRQETGKQRASRIPLDYYKRANGLEKWRLWLSLLALVVVLGGWLGWGLVRSDQVQGTYSRGPVAAVHAAWDHDCAACHAPFQRMSRDNWNPLMPFLGSPA